MQLPHSNAMVLSNGEVHDEQETEEQEQMSNEELKIVVTEIQRPMPVPEAEAARDVQERCVFRRSRESEQ